LLGISHTIFVRPDGDDTANGRSVYRAVQTLERAMELASELSGHKVVMVYPGLYQTQGHIDIPDFTSVKTFGAARATKVVPVPGFEERNVFRLGNAGYVEGFSFEGWRVDSLDNPTEGFAISFRPGALIQRVPYAHNITVWRSGPPELIPPPIDREAGNPLVPRGGGVILADASIVNQNSPFPNIMAWGATPSTPNGIGYCAKNGAVINAINAISLWAHKHYLALDGGIIILNGCSSQFGDYALWSEGYTQVLRPRTVAVPLVVDTVAAAAIEAAEDDIVNTMWNTLVTEGLVTGWTAQQEEFTRRDARRFLLAVRYGLLSGQDQPVRDFARGLYTYQGAPVFNIAYLPAFVRSFEIMRDEMNAVVASPTTNAVITDYAACVNDALNSPVLVRQPSQIAALGHQWTQPLAGVNKNGLPESQRRGGVIDVVTPSIVEKDGGVVRASGQDDSGNAIFVGGMTLDARTGRLGGRPFTSAVNSIARRAALIRSFG
jgi:hypothetical protein